MRLWGAWGSYSTAWPCGEAPSKPASWMRPPGSRSDPIGRQLAFERTIDSRLIAPASGTRFLLKIASDTVVAFLYTLKDESGRVLDQSDVEPMAYLHGHGQIVPGLEQELTGRTAGEKLQVRVEPAQGYGEHDAALIQKLPLEAFKGIPDLRVGMALATRTRSGGVAQVFVSEVGEDGVTIDGNHALAGKALFFDVEIVDVRAASEEELSHRHVHGPGGHHH